MSPFLLKKALDIKQEKDVVSGVLFLFYPFNRYLKEHVYNQINKSGQYSRYRDR